MRQTCLLLFLLSFTAFTQTRARLADYALILQEEPVARSVQTRSELFGAKGRPQLLRIRAAQSSLLAELARRNVPVAGTSQILLNAIFVNTDRDTAVGLRAIPGVTRVVYLKPLRPDLNTAVNLINAPAAWTAAGGVANAGAGIRIGIIDSGIDQNHAAFQDASLTPPANYPPANASYPNNTSFTNNKVIVARSFVNQTPFTDPNSHNSLPDDLTPRDRMGHGTAIAMIAAGAANNGPLATIQGIAPKAFLGNYKVEGTPGVNDFARVPGVVAALTAALQDGMDIVTLAYGEGDMPDAGPLDVDAQLCANNGVCDPVAQAVQAAVASGLVVIAAAGNDGNLTKLPTLGTIHTPGTAPSAITVGASTNSHVLYQAVRPLAPNPPAAINALFGDGPQVQAALSGPIKDAAQAGNDGLACGALTAGSMANAIALIQRGTCGYSVKITNAQNAGAIAVVLYQSTGNEVPYSALGAADTGIPAIMIGHTDGVSLKAWTDANAAATVTLDPVFTATNATANVVADFSSRGPAIGTYGLKPELVAPGVNLYTATQKADPNSPMYHASGYTAATGTSMAVGLAAGTAALVKQTLLQKYPSSASLITPAVIKSALVNTATTDVVDSAGAQARVRDVGAGKLNAGAAATTVIGLDPAVISFGLVAAGSLPISGTLFLTNFTTAAETATLAVVPRDTDPNASVHLSQASINLPAGARSSITVTLQGTTPAAGSYEGAIQVTVGSSTYVLPYVYVVSDGKIDTAYPVYDGSFLGATGDTGWLLELKVIDRVGAPLVGVPVVWNVVSGGGAITLADTQSFSEGIAAAIVNLGTTIGDQVFTATVGTASSNVVVTFNGYAAGYQTVAAIVDGATFQTRATPNGFAPGSYISLFGSYLAPAAQAVSTAALPYSLSSASVGFYASGLRVPGRLAYVSPGQVNVQIPWELQGQTSAQMVLNIGFEPSASYTVPLAQYSPGVFQYYDATQNKMFATALDLTGNYWVWTGNPARRGDTLRLYLNGLGPVSNQPATGEVTGASVVTNALPSVSIGGKTAALARSAGGGMTQGWIGVYEVDVVVAADAATGSNSPVVVTIGGVNSATVNLPVQ